MILEVFENTGTVYKISSFRSQTSDQRHLVSYFRPATDPPPGSRILSGTEAVHRST